MASRCSGADICFPILVAGWALGWVDLDSAVALTIGYLVGGAIVDRFLAACDCRQHRCGRVYLALIL